MIVLNGTELGDFPETPEGYKALQQAASVHAKSLLGKCAFNPALNADIYVRQSGIKKLTRLGSSRLKLKLIPATLALVENAVKAEPSKASNDPKERNIVAYHYLKTLAMVGEEEAQVFIVVKEDDKGTFVYEEFVNKNALRGIAGVTSEQ
jgi:hypothetical protein